MNQLYDRRVSCFIAYYTRTTDDRKHLKSPSPEWLRKANMAFFRKLNSHRNEQNTIINMSRPLRVREFYVLAADDCMCDLIIQGHTIKVIDFCSNRKKFIKWPMIYTIQMLLLNWLTILILLLGDTNISFPITDFIKIYVTYCFSARIVNIWNST